MLFIVLLSTAPTSRRSRTPRIFYMANVLLHLGLGLALMVPLAVLWRAAIRGSAGAFLAARPLLGALPGRPRQHDASTAGCSGCTSAARRSVAALALIATRRRAPGEPLQCAAALAC